LAAGEEEALFLGQQVGLPFLGRGWSSRMQKDARVVGIRPGYVRRALKVKNQNKNTNTWQNFNKLYS